MKVEKRLRDEVIEALDREPSIDSGGIAVAVEDGIVTLTGHVSNFAQKAMAEKVVQRVYGVRGIAEELTVMLPSASERSDTDVATAAANALAWDVMIPDKAIKVKVEHGVLTLQGSVDYGFEKREAERVVRNLTGVRNVINLILVKPKASSLAVSERIEKQLLESAERDAHKVRVETRDGTVTLSGTVRSWIEREDAAKAAWSTPGISRVQNYITVGS